jgi:hypothetical protein
MPTIKVNELDHSHISKIVKFTIPNPMLTGYKNTVTPTITVVGVLSAFVRTNSSQGVVLHVGNGQYSIDEVWQEITDIHFLAED